ncbi:MAG: DUF368 domain-containing protein, partial [Desulfobacterales bacterium]|nr:DUF368 domain-containing protein [Desulfobacterales bacterium]
TITIISPATTPEAMWFVFLSGAVAICAMILPGISGSFILVLLGKYQFVLDAVSSFKLNVIAVIGAGAVCGLLGFSNILSWLLSRYRDTTIAVLAGFMVGSLNKIWPWKIMDPARGTLDHPVWVNALPSNFLGMNQQAFLPAFLIALVGFCLIFVIEKQANKFEK